MSLDRTGKVRLAKVVTIATWRPKEGETVKITVGGRAAGEVCMAAGGMIPHTATVACVSGDMCFINGVPRAFTLRRDGTWVMKQHRMDRSAPRLERVDP